MIVLSSFVFSIVMVMLVYAVWRWRAKPGDESDGAPIHGNTRLEIAWTVIPTVIVLFGAIYSWITLSDIEAHDPNRMVVDVYSQQYEWHFDYPETGTTSRELHVPVNRQIEFRMHALDVIHSFWVPEWRIKKDNVPGITTRAYITPTKTGRLHSGLHGALRHRPLDHAGAGGGRALADRLAAVGLEPAADQVGRGGRGEAAVRADDPQAGAPVTGRAIGIMPAMEGWRE